MAGTIAIGGALAQKSGCGGHTWALLQYVLGFRLLGYDVLFVDWLDDSMCRDEAGRPCDPEQSVQLRYLSRVMRDFGLHDNYVCMCGGDYLGMDRAAALQRVGQSSMLVNINGYVNQPEILAAATKRVFLDIDPGYPQMWRESGLHDAMAGHDTFVTIAMNIGRPRCTIPTCGLEWITTLQPVVLSCWPPCDAHHDHFTSVATWRGSYGTLSYAGRTYGPRAHEFRKFFELPSRTGRNFEVALHIDPAETTDLTHLHTNNWSLVSPDDVAGNPRSYRQYIQKSYGEFSVSQNMYVQTQSGWFSDRSACYLASGKPVIAQEAGISDFIRTGDGLLTYSTLEEAEDCLQTVTANYAHHAQAARRLAEEHFDSDKVLGRLLDRLN